MSDAVDDADLRNTNALMFRNPNSGDYNMVYRRDDGNHRLVEPSSKWTRTGWRLTALEIPVRA